MQPRRSIENEHEFQMSKTKFRDKGLSPSVAEADRMMAEMPRYQINEDDERAEVKWHDFEFGSMRGQYRILENQIDLLSVANLKPNNGHFRRLLKYASRHHERVRILLPHERLRAHLIRNGFVNDGEHVVSRS